MKQLYLLLRKITTVRRIVFNTKITLQFEYIICLNEMCYYTIKVM